MNIRTVRLPEAKKVEIITKDLPGLSDPRTKLVLV